MNRWTKRCMAFVLTLTIICTYIDNYMYFNERSETNSGNDICGHCAKYYEVSKGCMQEDGCGESTVRI